jgi:hypothetical protein
MHFYPFKIYVSFLGGRIRLDATILTRITSKGAAKFKLKFFQIDSFLTLLEFLNPLIRLIKLLRKTPKFYFVLYFNLVRLHSKSIKLFWYIFDEKLYVLKG